MNQSLSALGRTLLRKRPLLDRWDDDLSVDSEAPSLGALVAAPELNRGDLDEAGHDVRARGCHVGIVRQFAIHTRDCFSLCGHDFMRHLDAALNAHQATVMDITTRQKSV